MTVRTPGDELRNFQGEKIIDELFDDESEKYGDDEYAGAPTGESEIGQDNDGFGGDGL